MSENYYDSLLICSVFYLILELDRYFINTNLKVGNKCNVNSNLEIISKLNIYVDKDHVLKLSDLIYERIILKNN